MSYSQNRQAFYAINKETPRWTIGIEADIFIDDGEALIEFIAEQIEDDVDFIIMSKNISEKVRELGIKTTTVSVNDKRWLVILSYKES